MEECSGRLRQDGRTGKSAKRCSAHAHKADSDNLGQVPKGKIPVGACQVYCRIHIADSPCAVSFLTLPRLPFVEPGKAELTQSTLDSLAALLGNKHALKVLKILKDASDEVRANEGRNRTFTNCHLPR